MADGTAIEWTDATWNVINGCSVKSPGCAKCYAMRLAGTRLKHVDSREGLTIDTKAGPVWNGTTKFNEPVLLDPIRWKRARRIFVCAHGDLFHESVPDEWIDRVFAVMALAPQHQFQVLTKRSARMREYFAAPDLYARVLGRANEIRRMSKHLSRLGDVGVSNPADGWKWVWLGVSVEDQTRAAERIPDLLATPAAVRWLSCEPLLGPVDLSGLMFREEECPNWEMEGSTPPIDPETGARECCTHCDYTGVVSVPAIDWIVAGGESGPGARPMHPDWARSLRDQCAAAGVAFLFKQWGAWLPWEPDQLPYFKSQTGELIDRHEMPTDFDDATAKGWSDARLYDGDDICVHQRVGKKAAGRELDGVIHDGFPA
ncbi:phage Gp37/Gp68 family protein [soil metagenome]